jgi:hypothetical protein
MGRLEEFLCQGEQLSTDLAAANSEIRKERQKAKDRAKAAKKHWQLTPWLQKVAMVIYMLAAYRAAPAIRFLKVTARKRRWPERSDEDLEELVGSLFLEWDVEVLVHISDLEDPEDPVAAAEALKYVEEWRAFEYVKDLNQRLGLAPSTEDVLQQLEQNRLQIPIGLRPVTRGVAAEVKARMWARRWRARWGARHGKLRILDDIPFAEIQSKALLLLMCWFRFLVVLGVKCGPVLGSRFRHQKWARLCDLLY